MIGSATIDTATIGTPAIETPKMETPKIDSAVEHVLVVPTVEFHAIGHFQGFSFDAPRYLDHLLQDAFVAYRPRPDMERDPSFKQLIPYVLFRHTDANGNVALLAYTRGKGQGESRLHSKRSIGIGGHISLDDHKAATGGRAAYLEGMRRELAEEVAIDTPSTDRCVGLINDDETEVGKVHLGIVHIVDVESPNVSPNEDEMMDCGFVPISELWANRERLETWSQICLDALFA